MTESGGIAPPTWFLLAALAVGLYRCAMAILLSAFHALPSLQRRRLLEEETITNPRLEIGRASCRERV